MSDAAYALKGPVDQAKTFSSGKEGKALSGYVRRELGHIRNIADLQQKLAKYKKHAQGMTEDQLLEEKHSSQRLGLHMRAQGIPRPARRTLSSQANTIRPLFLEQYWR